MSIEMRPVTDIRPGDVLSTDGYSVTAVVRLQGGGAPDEIMVATALEGHEKTGYFAPEATLPVWTPDECPGGCGGLLPDGCGCEAP